MTDELLIRIANETVSFLSVKVHPVRGRVKSECEGTLSDKERGRGVGWGGVGGMSVHDESHTITFLIWCLPRLQPVYL